MTGLYIQGLLWGKISTSIPIKGREISSMDVMF